MLPTSFILLFTFMIISLESFTYGFCIYNKMTGNNLAAVQIHGYGREYTSKFSKVIAPGNSDCCHFSNRDCNAGGTQDDLLLFTFYSEADGTRGGIRTVGMLAGGYAVVSGNPYMYNLDVFDAHDQRFEYRT